MTRTLTAEACYRALRSRDRRFDGVFFVGVRTTGVYCRPVCRARKPQARNCVFFRTAAEAEREGYRPCLRCRPELAPGRSPVDAASRMARVAAVRIADLQPSADIARDLGVSERHLRRVVTAELGASPIELVQTQRLLLAKQLLTETDLPVSRIAFASGFSSLSRFNALFRARYRMSPTALRRLRHDFTAVNGTVTLLFEYRPPFDWAWLLGFLADRAIPGIEAVRDGTYTRSLRSGQHSGWISVAPAARHEHALAVRISESLAPALLPVRAAVRRLFDLDAEPGTIVHHFECDPILGPLVRRRPGLRLPGATDTFELAVRAVLGQHISVAAARRLAGRLHRTFGEPVAGPPGIDRVPAAAGQLAAADPATIRALGIPWTRTRTLVQLGRSVDSGEVDLGPKATLEEGLASLCGLPGIGPWTAEYIAMRGHQWPDAFPATDLGIRRALRGEDPVARAEAWRPWRAYAAVHLWASLADEG